jgi:hypothetical protein
MVVNRKRPLYTLKGKHGSKQRDPGTHNRSTMVMNRRIPTRKQTFALQPAISFVN